jgi:hypothetical protein
MWAGTDVHCLSLRWAAAKVGWVRTERKVRADGGWELTSEARLAVSAMGTSREVWVDGTVTVSEEGAVDSFFLGIVVGSVPYRITGRRQGNHFVVRQGTKRLWTERYLNASVAEEMAVADPVLGTGTALPPRGGTLKYLNPLTLEVEEAKVKRLSKDTVVVCGAAVEANLLEVDSFGLRSYCWVDDNGELLKAETALGIEAVKVPCGEESFTSLRPLEAMRVVTKGGIPAGSHHLTVRLEVPAGLRIRSHRQTWAGDTLFVSSELPPSVGPTDVDSTYRLPGPLVESNHPLLVARARELVGREADPWRKAVLLLEWVHGYLRKEPSPGLPSALAALESGTGDCNEHTALFVALCRAAGLAADMRAGVAHVPGHGFGYHAWAAVHVGRWVEMDPTWGQDLVDASHISLIEGSPQEQLELGTVGQRLTVRVLAAR